MDPKQLKEVKEQKFFKLARYLRIMTDIKEIPEFFDNLIGEEPSRGVITQNQFMKVFCKPMLRSCIHNIYSLT